MAQRPPHNVIRYPSAAVRPLNVMGIDDLLDQSRSQRLADSIGPIAAALASTDVVVPTSGPVPPPPTPVPLRVGADAEGRLWVYAYTSTAEFVRVFDPASTHATIAFAALFRIVDADPNLAGILLNSGSPVPYPIMRTLFEAVRRVTRQSADG
jgi:hypothetical protein